MNECNHGPEQARFTLTLSMVPDGLQVDGELQAEEDCNKQQLEGFQGIVSQVLKEVMRTTSKNCLVEHANIEGNGIKIPDELKKLFSQPEDEWPDLLEDKE